MQLQTQCGHLWSFPLQVHLYFQPRIFAHELHVITGILGSLCASNRSAAASVCWTTQGVVTLRRLRFLRERDSCPS